MDRTCNPSPYKKCLKRANSQYEKKRKYRKGMDGRVENKGGIEKIVNEVLSFYEVSSYLSYFSLASLCTSNYLIILFFSAIWIPFD